MLAWILATSRDPAVYEPRTALGLAKEGVALKGQEPLQLDTLAVAHAALGEFEQALELERRALTLARAGRPELVPTLQSRIDSFQSKRPVGGPGQ